MGNEFRESLKNISKQFLCCVPTPEITWKNTITILAENYDLQQTFVNKTVNLSINIKYPIKISYQIAFLKEVISRLEKQNAEIHDDLYAAYGRLMAQPNQEQFFYKHYVLDNDKQVTLKESASLISEGTTGLRTWQASLALCEWILANKNFITNKRILELGSGVGLVGSVVSEECYPEMMYLTDCHLSVLDLLCENIKVNAKEKESVKNDDFGLENRCHYKNLGPPHISVLNLPWEEIEETVCRALGPISCVIAADIVYDKDLFDYLIGAINNLSMFCGVQNFIFACTERNPETLNLFRDKIGEIGFRIEELHAPKQHNFYWPENTPVKIFKFRK